MVAMRFALMFTSAALLYAASPLTEGNLQSPVRVIIYEDLQCSDCAVFAVMMEKQILPKNRFIF